VGLDLNEVAPRPGTTAKEWGSDWNANVGARVLYKMIGAAPRGVLQRRSGRALGNDRNWNQNRSSRILRGAPPENPLGCGPIILYSTRAPTLAFQSEPHSLAVVPGRGATLVEIEPHDAPAAPAQRPKELQHFVEGEPAGHRGAGVGAEDGIESVDVEADVDLFSGDGPRFSSADRPPCLPGVEAGLHPGVERKS